MKTKYIIFSALAMICLCLTTINTAYCKDLGVFGQTYPIQEYDLLDYILNKVKTMQNNGEWSRLQNQFNNNVARHADRPHPVELVERATKDASWNYDPSITVHHDLTNENGKVFAKAGQIINLLHVIKLHSLLVFFNSDDDKQVSWVHNYLNVCKLKVKLILVRGSISEVEKTFKTQIYFDQEGKLTNRFHIEHVPAIVQQDGDKLKISEVAI